MEKNVIIVNFNTPELTEAAVKSLFKHTPDCKVTILDNSDSLPLKPMEGVEILDNTKNELIDFDKILSQYPNKAKTSNNYGSAKHSISIDWLFDLFPEGFVLMDSDVLVKKDISSFFDERYAYVGEEHQKPEGKPRLLPFLCFVNTEVCLEYGVRYFDGERCWKLKTGKTAKSYDTGASFLEDCKKAGLCGKEVSIKDYIEHLGRGSWGHKDFQPWLKEHEKLYQEEFRMKTTQSKTIDLEGKIPVVIPYLASAANGRELEFAVAGWRKHFKSPYHIFVVGDYDPVCDSGEDITFIESPRVKDVPGEYRAHLDHVQKFTKVMTMFPEMKGFIYACDDMYAVNDFDMTDVLFLKQNHPEIIANPSEPNRWRQNNAKTKALLIKEGLPTRNFICHLPVYFEVDKLKEIYEKYDCAHNSYVVENLYFNTYFKDRVPLQINIDFDNLKCGVYRPNPRLWYIENAFKDKIWISNSPEGYIPELVEMLENHYYPKERR